MAVLRATGCSCILMNFLIIAPTVHFFTVGASFLKTPRLREFTEIFLNGYGTNDFKLEEHM